MKFSFSLIPYPSNSFHPYRIDWLHSAERERHEINRGRACVGKVKLKSKFPQQTRKMNLKDRKPHFPVERMCVYIAGYGRKGNVTRGHNCIVDCEEVIFSVRSNSGDTAQTA
jgi:hypothetical protein